ncbi:capsular polysaccharide synthesis protein [Actinoplanes sp. G11-F43]|uniref:capsular polysaccharide synthesis protein n=1 Tax=Actinoplanes sp. G11-F43 TaxID=3424130 RepID=UPI003D34CA7C
MTATAPTDQSMIARFRAALRRTPPSQPDAVPAPPPLVNLVPDPGFRGDPEGFAVPGRVAAERAEVPGRHGAHGLRVSALRGNDTSIAPGGIALRPGTYTAAVSLFLPEPLHSPPRLTAEWTAGDGEAAEPVRSVPARNEHGHHRISVTFTVPDGAQDVAVWLTAGNGTVTWYDYAITETAGPVGHFSGATPSDGVFRYEWTGEPDASPSRRILLPETTGVMPAAPSLTAEEAAHLLRRAADAPMTAARIALAVGDRETAVAELRRVAKAGDPDGSAAWELGRIALAEQRWAAAEQLLRGAVAKRPEDFARGYALAHAYDKLKRRDDSRKAAAAALAHDAKLPFDGPALLDSDVTAFGARRELGVFLAEHLAQIRTQAEQRLARPAHSTFDQPIFVYWAQGFATAPPVVRACLAALKATNPSVHELSLDTIGAYVDVPVDLAAAVGDDHAHFSDLLRMLLLEKFGGIWVDATCFVSEPLRPHVDRALAKSSVFAFNYTGPYLANWFLAGRPDSYVMHLWRAASFLWWEKRAETLDPLLHHHVFEMLHRLDDRFRAEWDAGLRLNATPPHALQTVMLRPYEPEMFQTIVEGAFVHRLRHQFRPEEMSSESYVARIIRGDH